MKKLLVLIACLPLAACGPYQLTPAERDSAELGARSHAERVGAAFVSCSGQDSDGDSYVTCTIKPAGQPETALLCAYSEGAKGCKPKG